MARKPTFRQLLVSILAFWRDLSHKELGAAAGIPQKRVSLYLRRGEIPDEAYERLLAALGCSPATVVSVGACLESVEAFEEETDLTSEEKATIAEAMRRVGRLLWDELSESARHSRTATAEVSSETLAYDRERAAGQLARLAGFPQEVRLAAVEVAEELRSWALCERACAVSVREASRDLDRAAEWAQLAQHVAERVPDPEPWRDRLRGYAAAHVANVLRVSGDLGAADTVLEEAKRLWRAGSDPAAVLDPGRLPDLEASLRRDQRRFPEALSLLDEAAAMGRRPERVLIQKGTTLEIMGLYEKAVEALLRALPIVQEKRDRRLETILCCNLALNYCQLGRFAEAAELAGLSGIAALEMGDEIGALRVTWTQGRIAAGLGRSEEARALLAQARQGFAARRMDYDAALALLEESALLLDEGRAAEVKAMTRELAALFGSKGVHREAVAALRLFHEAAEREEATAELASQREAK